jgi:tRNA-specific 2-thiouridylase
MKGRVVVAMSGGVDSSVTAALLREGGHAVTGVFLRSGYSEDRPGGKGCCTLEDAADARAVAARLGIPFYVLSLREGFDRLIGHFVNEYRAGRTPSPCVLCNQWLKFGALLEYARKIGARAVATGHYARVEEGPVLRRGVDAEKDQSYFLFSLRRDQLASAMFPLGGVTKVEVREMAGRFDLPVKEKEESQEICFVPDEGHTALIEDRSPGSQRPGPILDGEGKEIGRHEGIAAYTVGQRRGIRISAPRPLYVTRIDAAANAIHVGFEDDLLGNRFEAGGVSWLLDPPRPGDSLQASIQIRYRSRPADGRIDVLDDGHVCVELDDPVRAIAPGQAAVFYEGDRVLGGGWILGSGGR